MLLTTSVLADNEGIMGYGMMGGGMFGMGLLGLVYFALGAFIFSVIFWATGYNIFAIPLAAGVLYNAGILISPAVGAALMSLSTVIVAINARFLSIKK